MFSRRKVLLAALGAGVVLSVAGGYGLNPVEAKPAAKVFTGLLKGVAVGGYDPVAYFKDGKPVRGQTALTVQYQGAEWRFANAENRAAFEDDPEKFAPAYGGYCAWAVSQGYTAKGDPKHWKIVNGRLFLNYNGSVQSTWEKDIPGNVSKADRNWPKLAGSGA